MPVTHFHFRFPPQFCFLFLQTHARHKSVSVSSADYGVLAGTRHVASRVGPKVSPRAPSADLNKIDRFLSPDDDRWLLDNSEALEDNFLQYLQIRKTELAPFALTAVLSDPSASSERFLHVIFCFEMA